MRMVCYLCRKSTIYEDIGTGRDEARRLQRSGSSRRMKKEASALDLLSFQSCRSSVEDHVEEMSLESPIVRLQGRQREEEEKMRGDWNQKGKRRRWKPKLFRTGGRRPRGPQW